jgi:hypothetical protein
VACGGAALPWWELPDDAGYLWAHLARHLAGAGRVGDLRSLVTDLRWAAAKLARPQLGPVAVEADVTLAQELAPGDGERW